MKVVILAGGLGTRLTEETITKPKPMVEIGSMPILLHIMKYYMKFGYNDFVILAGYKQEIIKNFFVNYNMYKNDIVYDSSTNKIYHLTKNKSNFKVTILHTGDHSNTGGRLLRAKHILKKEKNFLMTYGDGLSDVNIKKLIECHKKNKKICTLTAVSPSGKFGDLVLKDNLVTKFNEKPVGGKNWVNGGYFVISNNIFKYLKDDQTVFESDSLAKLASHKQLTFYKHEGFWKPMDTINDKIQLDEMIKNNNAPWLI
tara:strand:- start:28590 stop:29357 length:768 start_codon:yes stop_codon:yes gene_type:complete